MPSDPVIWTDDTQPGKMKHTFSGLRPAFPNQAIHFICMEYVIPIRKQMMSLPQRMTDKRWEENLATSVQGWLESIRRIIQETVHSSEDELKPLTQRQAELQQKIDEATGKGVTSADAVSLEKLSGQSSFSHSDETLWPNSPRIPSLQFDYSGKEDPDLAQPTEGRVKDPNFRAIITELDGLIVMMSTSPSADNARTINEYDAKTWIDRLTDMFMIVQRAASKTVPHLPAGVLRSDYDDLFNADGSFDPPLQEGSGAQQGEPGVNPGTSSPS